MNSLGMKLDIYGGSFLSKLPRVPSLFTQWQLRGFILAFELHWIEPKLMGHFMHGPEPKDLGPKNLRTKGLNTQGPKTDDSVTGNQRTWSLDVSLFFFFFLEANCTSSGKKTVT